MPARSPETRNTGDPATVSDGTARRPDGPPRTPDGPATGDIDARETGSSRTHRARPQGAATDQGRRHTPWWRSVLRAALGIALAAALVVWGLPHFAETTWGALWADLRRLRWDEALALLALTVGALGCYTFTLTGALPGLTHPQALMVNVAGSAAGNLLPGGGAVGAATTIGMYRSWGFGGRDISTSLIVTGVWNVLARMALPVLGIGILVLAREPMPPGVARGGAVGALVGVGLLTWFVATLASERVAQATGRALDLVVGPIVRLVLRRPGAGVADLVHDLRGRIGQVVATGWAPMTGGLVGFFGLQYALFVMCLHVTGVHLSLAHLFAAFAVGRLLTAVGVTPGGVGVTEAGTAIALVGFGAEHAPAAAGIVLFTICTHLAELPLGALGALSWWLSRGHYARRRAGQGASTPAH